MKNYSQATNKKISFLTAVALSLAVIFLICIIKSDPIYLFILLAAILIASLALIIYWFVKRKTLPNTEKWGIILSIIVWSALFYSLARNL